jgi:hypothetical protein
MPDWNNGKFTVSSIILKDSAPKSADSTAPRYLDENAPPRVFAPGFRIPYSYFMYNLHHNPDKHAQIEVRSQLFRDGVAIYTSDPKLIDIDLPVPSKPAVGGGYISLTGPTHPGHYIMHLTIADKLAPGPAPPAITRTIDFQVRP